MLDSIAQVLLGSGGGAVGDMTQNCPMPQLSCHNTTVVENLCCFNAPGGQLLQTQFWDTAPATGPDDSWTLHGLWPDRCDGTYDANCDPSRIYRNITSILSASPDASLLPYMSTYWKDYQGNDETFWQHEWSKHGTCISTLEPHCYPNHRPTEEVVAYFQKAVALFQTLPSYEWLADAGITPSTTATYTMSQIQAAIQQHRPGVPVTLRCRAHALNEIWYHFDVRGSLQTGVFVPAHPDGMKSSCPEYGIKYLPKHALAQPPPRPTVTTVPTTTANNPAPTATSVPGPPFSGRGFLQVEVEGHNAGCVISKGLWFASGTCATFAASAVDDSTSSSDIDSTSNSTFTLSSSKGPCAISHAALRCSKAIKTPTLFSQLNGGLAVDGDAVWSAERRARGRAQEGLYVGGERGVRVRLVWEGV
ncbi:hypothetical protein J1614_001796 [Plenodomus biglobosus]|nr:hypothetical protein J1614_001796 [Plenodomus biglobosus]